MPYKMPAHLRAQLDAIDVAKDAAKEAAREVARERSPLAKRVRDLMHNLERAQAARHKMVHGNGVCVPEDERTAATIHGTRWHENAKRITELKSKLLDAELSPAFFDKDNHT